MNANIMNNIKYRLYKGCKGQVKTIHEKNISHFIIQLLHCIRK